MFLAGERVQITPKTAEARKFWAYVDGWVGTVHGTNMGNIEVHCLASDGVKTLFIPPDCLTKAPK